MACNCNYLLFFIWLLTMKTGEHLLHCDYSYYSLNTIVSCLVNRKIIELCITKKVKVKVTQSCLTLCDPMDRGNRLLEGTDKTLYTPGPRRKEQWPHKRLSQTCLWISRSLQWRYGLTVSCHWVMGTEYNSLGSPGCSHKSFRRRSPLLLSPLPLPLPLPNYREGTQPDQSTENWIKDLLSMAPPIRFPHSQALSSVSCHKLLILSHHQGRQNENHSHRKQTRLITWITALFNSMKLWALPCKSTQDGWVMMESSDKMWSTGEGNGKPLQFSFLENPMNSMKRQKDMTLKD